MEAINALTLSELCNRIEGKLKTPDLKQIWVSCELTSVTNKSHYYLELTETKDNKILAKLNAKIWADTAEKLIPRFEKVTGMKFAPGLSVMVRLNIGHHPTYGLDGTITDINAEHTVGKWELHLQRIRQYLADKRLITKNRDMNLPAYFHKIAVLAPKGSAGVDDFEKGALPLSNEKLCSFSYYYATMQGDSAEESMGEALARINNDHKNEQYDALVILRGGGAVSGLNYLSNFKAALYICNSYMPVITALGHERDRCLLDELSCKSIGTPSKAIALITKTNLHQISSLQAMLTSTYNSISRMSENSRTEFKSKEDRAQLTLNNTLNHHISNMYTLPGELRGKIDDKLKQESQVTTEANARLGERLNTSLSNGALATFEQRLRTETQTSKIISDAAERLNYSRQLISNISGSAPLMMANEILSSMQTIRRISFETHRSEATSGEEKQNKMLTQLSHTLSDAAASLFNIANSFETATSSHGRVQKEKMLLVREGILLHDPKKVLSQGYTLTRDESGNVIKSAEQARRTATIKIQYTDGEITAHTADTASQSN